MMKRSPPTFSPGWTMNTIMLYRPSRLESIPSQLYSQLLAHETRLIFKAKALEGNHHLRSTLLHVAEEDSPEGMVAVASVLLVVTQQEDMVVVTRPTSQGTSFLHARYVERAIIRPSSVSSGLIPHIWVKRRM
jgi:hypothetical protein